MSNDEALIEPSLSGKLWKNATSTRKRKISSRNFLDTKGNLGSYSKQLLCQEENNYGNEKDTFYVIIELALIHRLIWYISRIDLLHHAKANCCYCYTS